jgi:hypothetical protein
VLTRPLLDTSVGFMDNVTTMPTADNTSRAVLIDEVEKRLQFNVFVSIFFCTLLYSFFRSMGRTMLRRTPSYAIGQQCRHSIY